MGRCAAALRRPINLMAKILETFRRPGQRRRNQPGPKRPAGAGPPGPSMQRNDLRLWMSPALLHEALRFKERGNTKPPRRRPTSFPSHRQTRTFLPLPIKPMRLSSLPAVHDGGFFSASPRPARERPASRDESSCQRPSPAALPVRSVRAQTMARSERALHTLRSGRTQSAACGPCTHARCALDADTAPTQSPRRGADTLRTWPDTFRPRRMALGSARLRGTI